MDWRLHLGYGDLLLERTLLQTPHLTITPLIGVRYGEIRHKARVLYSGGDLVGAEEDDISLKNKFWGVGAALGMRVQFRFTPFFIEVAGLESTLAGRFYLHQDEEIENGIGLRADLLDKFNGTATLWDLGMRLKYRVSAWTLGVGYTSFFVFGQNRLLQFLSAESPALYTTNLGDLTLQGFSFSAGVDF